MAIVRGCFGKVFADDLGGTPVEIGQVRSWDYEETAERIDVSVIGTCTKAFTAGAQETTGTLEMFHDVAANQGPLTVGNEIDLVLYPAGNGSGATYYKTGAGGAVITSVRREGSVDTVVGMTVGFAVNGALTATAVP